ncbi:hypothetical protein AVEN_40054-1 [Araneus ventricosus]|uniref:Uncharacterized protein n=1 Tax=Araneus ventricosus TaxID=182803 RepID=A0A4Y2VPY3_ARAVE|nr:hypothetical protein AVEN_40054-1 [Araneus ventricosus]
MYLPSNGSPRTANTWGYFAVHEKQEANRAATASHGELPRLPSREGRLVDLEESGGLMTAGESSKSSDMLYSNVSSSDEKEELISASASDSRDCKIFLPMEGLVWLFGV